MFKLILKDFYLAKVVAKWLLIFLAIILLRDSLLDGVKVLAISIICIRHSMILDDKFKTDSLFCSLPLKRNTIVISRYLSALAIILVVILLFNIVSYIRAKEIMTFRDTFLVLFYLVLFLSVFFPFYFRFGIQLKKDLGYVSFSVLMLFFVIVLIGSAIYSAKKPDVFKMENIFLYLGLVKVLFASISILLSLRIYSQREF